MSAAPGGATAGGWRRLIRMSTPVAVVAMVIIGVVFMVVGARPAPPPPAPPGPVKVDVPWLSREADAQLVGDGGEPGVLFEGVVLGLPASPPARERIAAFAKANGIDIALETVDGDVEAIRIGVTYGGCCGYEGAESLALRLYRRRTGSSCFGTAYTWINDWDHLPVAGVHVRASVRVNRITARWERPIGVAALVERVDALVGADRVAVARAAGDRWIELEPGRGYRLEVPQNAVDERPDPGITIAAHAGRIVEVSVIARDRDDSELGRHLGEAARARWGRRHAIAENVWTWHLPDREITVDVNSYQPRITIRQLEAR